MKFGWGISKTDPDNKVKLTNQYFERISDTKEIFSIFYKILNSNNKVTLLDFSECSKISTTGFTILAALGPLLQAQNREIHIESGNNEELTTRFLNIKNSKKYRKDIPFKLLKNQKSIEETLNNLELIPELAELKQKELNRYLEIWSRLYELCSNANEHGENEIGAVCNGVCNKGILTFSVFDFGKGLTKIINQHNNTNWKTRECIEWALDKANSTKQSLIVPRGAGFSTTINFVNKYKGQLILCTGDTYCIIKNKKKHYQKLEQTMFGTIITISICIN